MPAEITGDVNGAGKRFAVVVSRFNELLTRNLVNAAVDCLTRHGVSDQDITVIWVPGAFDLPLVAGRAAASGRHDGVVCLGVVIQGATTHHEHVGGGAAQGVARAAVEAQIPITLGVITANTLEQALERSGAKQGNFGWNAAMAALELVSLLAKIGDSNV